MFSAKLRVILMCVGIALVGGFLAFIFCDDGKAPAADAEDIVAERPVRKASAAPQKTSLQKKDAEPKKVRRVVTRIGRKGDTGEWTLDDFDDDEHPYSAKDKKVALELQLAQDALGECDDDDLAAIATYARGGVNAGRAMPENILAAKKARDRFRAAAEQAAKSANPAVRSACVDAYAWGGDAYLPELTPMMADRDAGVAEAAIDGVQQALDGMEDSDLRFDTAAAYMSTFSVNDEALDMFSSTLVSSALNVIDAEDDTAAAKAIARDNRNHVVETLATIIENGNGKSVKAAMEAYNDITSEDWVSREEAAKWAVDPDNYEAPTAN